MVPATSVNIVATDRVVQKLLANGVHFQELLVMLNDIGSKREPPCPYLSETDMGWTVYISYKENQSYPTFGEAAAHFLRLLFGETDGSDGS